jgi:hypothetical protein
LTVVVAKPTEVDGSRMRKVLFAILTLLTIGAVVAVLFICIWTDSPYQKGYKSIQPGMSRDEVEELLGPGTEVKQSEVPQTHAAINPEDVLAAAEKDKEDRRSGRPLRTTRDRSYPTRLKHMVEGDQILHWHNETGEEIYVAFEDGKVREKWYWRPSL